MEPADRAGSAYLVAPDDGPGPGVLVLHSWWGLTAETKAVCDRLADEGFVALAPDLSGGVLPETAAEAELELGLSDPNTTAALILSSVVALRSQTDDPDGPVAVIGFSMGASWGLWLATRQPDSVRALVLYYGHSDVDPADLAAPVLGHFATDDHLVTDDQVNGMLAEMKLLGREVEFHDYPGTRHWFAEEGHPEAEAHDPAAAALAWERTVAFLRATSSRR
jgi:carboxymethylenebutenolidase